MTDKPKRMRAILTVWVRFSGGTYLAAAYRSGKVGAVARGSSTNCARRAAERAAESALAGNKFELVGGYAEGGRALPAWRRQEPTSEVFTVLAERREG